MKNENFLRMMSDRTLIKQKESYFLGQVVLHDISKKIGIQGQKVYFVRFRNGAKTKLHLHHGGQTLLVVSGVGTLVLYKTNNIRGRNLKISEVSKTKLRIGDVVYIPSNTLHWHGAIKNNDFTHIAFNGFYKGSESKTIWYDSDFKSSATKIS